MANRTRRCCFTLNNWTEDEYNHLSTVKCKYIIYGKEVGTNGTPHLQGYVEFENGRTLKGIKRVLGNRMHVEPARGTPVQASDYCKKEGDFVEKGVLSAQGTRTDLSTIVTTLKNHGLKTVIDETPEMFLKFAGNLQKLATHYQKHRTAPPRVYWLWGAAGVGKTRIAVSNSRDYYIWNGSKFWNGYEQQSRVIIDDFTYDRTQDPGSYHYRYLLRLLDHYELNVEIKGGHIKFNSDLIFITCEFPPEHFWQHNEYDQIYRRLANVFEVDEVWAHNHLHTFDDPEDDFQLPAQAEEIVDPDAELANVDIQYLLDEQE